MASFHHEQDGGIVYYGARERMAAHAALFGFSLSRVRHHDDARRSELRHVTDDPAAVRAAHAHVEMTLSQAIGVLLAKERREHARLSPADGLERVLLAYPSLGRAFAQDDAPTIDGATATDVLVALARITEKQEQVPPREALSRVQTRHPDLAWRAREASTVYVGAADTSRAQ